MALNYIWFFFFIIAFAIALWKWIITGDPLIFKTVTEGIFKSANDSVDLSFKLIGIMTLFLGFMNIGEKAGAIRFLSKLVAPFFSKLFPELPPKHPAYGHMMMNFSANLLGLDNAATPFGLKAMESLQSINPDKEKATNAQIMFLVLHTSGLTLIPLTIISYRLAAGSTEAASIFIPCVLATICTTLASIFIVGFKQKLKWDKVLLTWLLGLVAMVAGMLFFVQQMGAEQKEIFSRVTGNMILLLLVVLIIIGGMLKKINVFDAFIDGAKGGFDVILKIIPYLVGMLVAIRVFRDSGALGYLVDGLSWVIGLTGVDTAFTPALPIAIMKPFSGSGARGLMIDVMKSNGPDSFVGKLASTFQGSADTTFYIIALYFGSVGIKKVRYAIWAGVLADLLGVVAAILIGYVFFS